MVFDATWGLDKAHIQGEAEFGPVDPKNKRIQNAQCLLTCNQVGRLIHKLVACIVGKGKQWLVQVLPKSLWGVAIQIWIVPAVLLVFNDEVGWVHWSWNPLLCQFTFVPAKQLNQGCTKAYNPIGQICVGFQCRGCCCGLGRGWRLSWCSFLKGWRLGWFSFPFLFCSGTCFLLNNLPLFCLRFSAITCLSLLCSKTRFSSKLENSFSNCLLSLVSCD